MFSKQVACPVCNATNTNGQPITHVVIARDGGVDCIACKSVTPTGAYRYFPPLYVKVLGAGLGVDENPPRVETEKDKAQRAAAIEDELRKIQEQEAAAKRNANYDARITELEAQLAAAKGRK